MESIIGYQGLEFGFEANVTSTLTLNGAVGHGQHIYTSRPVVTRVIDETDMQEPSELSYLINYRVGRTPQTAANIGFTYRGSTFLVRGIQLQSFCEYLYRSHFN